MFEIERKFLVKNTTFLNDISKSYQISQGYLNTDPQRTVRVRIKRNKGYLTIKGESNSTGTSRFEWEKEISLNEANQLLLLTEDYAIEKIRYEILFSGKKFEVDVFQGANQGLILAEIELTNENEFFEKPHWLGQEVTGDVKYYNAYLSKNPFTSW